MCLESCPKVERYAMHDKLNHGCSKRRWDLGGGSSVSTGISDHFSLTGT